jgi:general secretion pathway protein J
LTKPITQPTRHRGFTLVELLVAIAVMAALALMAWRSLDGMARTERHTRERGDQLLALQAGLGQWAADLDGLTETGEVPALEFDGRTLRLTRRDPLESDTHSPGLRVVAWALHNGQWSRWQADSLQTRQSLTQAWADAQRWGQRPTDADATRQVAVATADRWQVFYHRDNAWTNPLSSAGTSLPPATLGQPGAAALATAAGRVALPDGIRLVLTLTPGQPLSGELVRDWARPVLGGNKS